MEALSQGVANANWPARLTQLQCGPLVEARFSHGAVYLDGGHNAHAARALAAFIISHARPVHLLVGLMRRKEMQAFFAPLLPHVASITTVPIPGEDAYLPEELAHYVATQGYAPVRAVTSWEALPSAVALLPEGDLLVAGSLFLAGEILKNHSGEKQPCYS